MNALRLLLIDDDEDMYVLVRDFVAETARAWTVDWAPSYEAGLEGLSTGRYDAALLDYHLGEYTGVELLASVRSTVGLPPIILLTGRGDRAIDIMAMAAGATDYLEKGALSAALLDRTLRHAIERDRSVADLRASEAKYRGLFERSGDAVLVADDGGGYVDANPAACELLGVPRDKVIGRSLMDFVVPSVNLPDPSAAWAAFLAAGELRGQVQIRRPDGTVREAEFVAKANFTPGQHLSVLRDETERIAADVALVDSEARFRSALDGVGLHAVILDPEGRLLFVNRYHLARTGWTEDDLVGTDGFIWLSPEDRPDEEREVYRSAAVSGTVVDTFENTWRTRAGGPILISWFSSAIRDDEGRIVAVASVGEDVSARREAEATQSRLVAAIEQTAESVIVTDADGRMTYANPAFESVSGYAAADVLGKDLWAFLRSSGSGPASRRMSRRLRSGRSWQGELALRRRDGRSYREEVTISPVRDRNGAIISFVSVARDVTHLREIEASLDVTARERTAFARALAQLEQRDTPEETAQDITDTVAELPGIDIACLLSFDDAGDAHVLGITAPSGYPLVVGQRLPSARASYLHGRATHGEWAEGWVRRDIDGEYATAISTVGLRATAYAPVGNGDGIIGLIALGTIDEGVATRIQDQIPAALEFAAAARSLIAGPLAIRRRLLASRRRIEGIIAAGAHDPVFQPIVRLIDGVAVGYEALTRFRDGTSPQTVFAQAGAAGVGLELEEATLRRAIAASHDLPSGTWLAVNVSAAMILAGDRLVRLLSHRRRPIVLEITEHDAITDYGAVRDALAKIESDVRVAVDDAGTGVANFTHLLELRPAFVKIDASLVRGVQHDVARQALIVGLRHFSRATNGWVIAEGVETQAEQEALIGFGLTLGQGYLFGRPAPVGSWPSSDGLPPPDKPRNATAAPLPTVGRPPSDPRITMSHVR